MTDNNQMEQEEILDEYGFIIDWQSTITLVSCGAIDPLTPLTIYCHCRDKL